MQCIVNRRTEEGFADVIVEAKDLASAMEMVEGATGCHPLDELADQEGYIPTGAEARFIATVQTPTGGGAGFKRAGAKAKRRSKCLNGEPCLGDPQFHSIVVSALGPGMVNNRVWRHPALRGKVKWIHRITEIV